MTREEIGNENLYPIFIKKYKKDYCVFIPDLQGYTDEKTIEKAIESAKEYIRNIKELRGYLVPASNIEEAINKAKKDADDLFDYSDGLLVYVKI